MSVYKLIIIGSSGVGKTSLLNYYKYNKNINQLPNISTIGVDMYIQNINIDNNEITLRIWDTAGQEKFYSINKTYYRDSVGAILCFSLSSYDSFNDITKYIDDVRQYALQNTKILIVGTFLDREQIVKDEDVYKLMENKGITSYIKVSNLNGENVVNSFSNLISMIHQDISLFPDTSIKPNIIDPEFRNKKKYCC